MKTAIVYYSMSGNTEQTAKKIAERIQADLIKIEPEKVYPSSGFKKFFWGGKSAVMGETPALLPYEFRAEEYDRIIIGTPVWAGTFTPPIRTFINDNRESFKSKRVSAFVCLSGAGADKALIKLKDFIGVTNLEATLVLIDPKDKPNSVNDEKIEEFCSLIK